MSKFADQSALSNPQLYTSEYMKLAKQAGPSKWLRPFLATARMSLTLYILHIGVFQLFLIVSGLAEEENSILSAWVSAAVFCITSMLFSWYWVNRFGQGPLEKILRWLSKGSEKMPKSKIDTLIAEYRIR